MAFDRNLLNHHEELILDLRPHWLYMTPATIGLVVAVILGIASIATDWPGPGKISVGVLVLIALAYFGWRYLKWTTTNFVLTSDRILTRRGVFGKDSVEIPLERVNTVFTHQSLFERIVGAGDIAIESAGERGTERFVDIRKPSIVQKEVYVQMEANENRKYDRGASPGQPSGAAAAPAVTATHAVPEQIERLAELHQRGLITDEEYAQKKTELLGRM